MQYIEVCLEKVWALAIDLFTANSIVRLSLQYRDAPHCIIEKHAVGFDTLFIMS